MGCFVAAFLPGSPVFAVDITTAHQWWARPFLAAVRHFDVDPANAFSTKAMVQAVKDGERLVIFPEGRITRTGALMKVYEGAGLVADKAGAVIIPIRIDGLQDTKLSAAWPGRGPRRWFPRLSFTVMPAVELAVRSGAAAAIARRERRGHGAAGRDGTDRLRHREHAPTARCSAALLDARPTGTATGLADHRRTSTREADDHTAASLLGAAVLGRRLAALEVKPAATVGVMLPNANGAVVTFMALQAFGRVPAMLNFSGRRRRRCSPPAPPRPTSRVVLSSRAFIERAKLGPAVARMERRRALRLARGRSARRVGPGAPSCAAWLDARIGPPPARRARSSGRARRRCCSPAGRRARPRAVVLSHRNILANIAQVAAVVDFNSATTACSTPCRCSTAFGLTGGHVAAPAVRRTGRSSTRPRCTTASCRS